MKMPQKGTTNYAIYFTFHKLAELKMEGTGSQWVEEQVGISRNTDGKPFFDQMSVRCVGYVQEVKEDRTLNNGACVETDKDGDQVFATYDKKAHYLVGGTGKYKGISGASLNRSPPTALSAPESYGRSARNSSPFSVHGGACEVNNSFGIQAVLSEIPTLRKTNGFGGLQMVEQTLLASNR